jgi:hypothetical protein
MSNDKIIVIKSPLVPKSKIDDGAITYDNQVTYTVRLANGMVVARPEDYPENLKEKIENADKGEEETE